MCTYVIIFKKRHLMLQDSAYLITENLAGCLKNLSNNDNGFKNVRLGSVKVLTALGRLVTGCGDDGGNSSTSSNVNKSKTAVCSLFWLRVVVIACNVFVDLMSRISCRC